MVEPKVKCTFSSVPKNIQKLLVVKTQWSHWSSLYSTRAHFTLDNDSRKVRVHIEVSAEVFWSSGFLSCLILEVLRER